MSTVPQLVLWPGEPTAKVPLSRGQVALVDLADYERVNQFKWSAVWNGYSFYAVRRVNGKGIYLHRFVLDVDDGVQVDHKNLNGLDCRRENLRIATQAQNNQNRSKQRGGSSKYKGVDRRPSGKWRARIRLLSGQQIILGLFSDEKRAARAYDRAARKHFGSYSRPNFPDHSPSPGPAEVRG